MHRNKIAKCQKDQCSNDALSAEISHHVRQIDVLCDSARVIVGKTPSSNENVPVNVIALIHFHVEDFPRSIKQSGIYHTLRPLKLPDASVTDLFAFAAIIFSKPFSLH